MTGHDSIPTLVAAWADRIPDAIALECHDQTLTYRALHEEAGQLAAELLAARLTTGGGVVAVAAERSIETVVAILGVLRAGGVYFPLEIDGPGEHTNRLISRVRPTALLRSPSCDAGPTGLAEIVVRLGRNSPPPRDRPSAPCPYDGADPAYLMPTSGTAGITKIVEVTHRNVHYMVRALRDAVGGINPSDAYLHFASFAFSSSVRQLFLPLSSGARVVLATAAERRDPQATLRRIRRSHVSVLDVIPSFLSVLLDTIESGCESSEPSLAGGDLRLVLTASERLTGPLVQRWFAAAPANLRLLNMYGQTETSGIVTVQAVTRAHAECTTVPIGRPIPGTTMHLADAGGNSAAADSAEIVITGDGVARGYRGDPERTASAFPALDPAAGRRSYRTGDLGRIADDGALDYLGRLDSLVKIRGQRVDLFEVEQLLQRHPAVAEAVVADAPDENGGTRLVAAVRCRDGYIDAAIHDRLRSLPNGLRILDLNRSDTDFMYDEIFVRQVYRQYGITIADDACIIDAGANIGLFSLFAAAARPQARIFAVEPAAPATDVLTVNVAVNGYRNIAVRNVGFSDRRENATLTFYAHSVGLTSVHASPDGEAAQLTSIITGQFRRGDIDGHDELRDFTADLVEAKLAPQTLPCLLVRLSDFMAAEGIERVDLLKIDVQKSELQLLNGINDEDWPRIRQVVLELQDIGGVVNEAVALLTRLGYSVRIAQDTVFAGSDMYYLYARRALETAAIAEPDRTSVIPPPPPLQTVTPAQLLSFLGHRVTAAQRPTDLRILPDLPRTVSGKVDRASITQDLRHSAAHPAPPTEPSGDRYLTDVAAVWSEVLGKPVQGTDDFFDVGGNSLSAARVITRIRQRYIGDIPIRWIFEASRLQDFADRLRALEPAPEAPTTQ